MTAPQGATSASASVTPFIHPLHGWPTPPPPGYLGQLEPEFQAKLAAAAAARGPEECAWYHSTELSDGTVKEGIWDLRGREAAYLGNLALAGTRVLELGPASGHLTYWMEKQGASVTCFEVGYDARFEFVPPVDGTDVDAWYSEFMSGIGRGNNAWWYRHADARSNAKIAYGDIYNLPADIGDHDISVFGSILLHLRDPFRALQQAASHTTGTMVVTDLLRSGMEDPNDPVMRWGVHPHEKGPSQTWWYLSPGAVTRMLWRLGFGRVDLIRHTQEYHGPRERDLDVQPFKLFTVVATRSAHGPDLTRDERTLTKRARMKLGRMVAGQ